MLRASQSWNPGHVSPCPLAASGAVRVMDAAPPVLWLMLIAAAASGALIGATIRGQARGTRNRPPSALPPALQTSASSITQATVDDAAFHRLTIEHASDVLMRLDRTWRRVFVSPSCRKVFGYQVEEMLSQAPFQLVYPGDRGAVLTALASLGPREPVREATWRGVHRSGQILWVEAIYRHIPEDGGAVAILRDVTRRKLAEERLADARARLERMALTDSLTGLANRGGFLEAAERTLTADHELALLFIDLDRFRPVNDVHGHAAGDAVLREAAARLTRELRHEPMLARLGADEFGALIRVPNGDPGIAARARDLIRAIGEPMRIDGMTLEVGAAIGIAVCPRDGMGAEAVLRHAMLALARTKQEGGGGYRFFEPGMARALEQAAALKNELRQAIQRGEIVPWFQPMMRLSDMTLAGYEVLARWEHPTRGMLEAAAFLPLAEEEGVAAELFAALLTRACAVARDWPDGVGVSIDVSPRALRNEALPADVARILAATGLDGTRLEIEIAEHALLPDSRVALDVLEGVRAQGVSVALDGFGTEVRGLRHLRDLPFDKMKIDPSSLGGSGGGTGYVAAIVGLGHALGLELTAVGIADAAALAWMRELGCTYGQGGVFPPPVPAAALERSAGRREGPAS